MRIANSGHLRAGQKHGRREEESGSVAAASEAQHSAALNYFRLHQHRCSYGYSSANARILLLKSGAANVGWQ
ncbi:unnamed protein product [Urochloa humidicola]